MKLRIILALYALVVIVEAYWWGMPAVLLAGAFLGAIDMTEFNKKLPIKKKWKGLMLSDDDKEDDSLVEHFYDRNGIVDPKNMTDA